MIDTHMLAKLFAAAREASQEAYAPYSQFHVGAAILTFDGDIVSGCNVENSSFGLTICAERTAATRAIVQGKRKWQALVVVSPTGVSPCGACRQFLAEFASELPIWFGYLDATKPTSGPILLSQLLPIAMKFPTADR